MRVRAPRERDPRIAAVITVFYIILDGLVLLGLMYVFDRNNPYRDFLETGAVAFFLIVAEFTLGKLQPLIGSGILVLYIGLILYIGLCLLLLWKFVGMTIHKALLISAAFFVYKIGLSFAVQKWLVDPRSPTADQTLADSNAWPGDSFIRIAAGKSGPSHGAPFVSYLVDSQRAYWNESRNGATAFHVPDIDPSDIETLEILEPTSAQQRFGTCPGVELIVITTKSRTWRPPTAVAPGPCPRIP